MSNTTRCLSMAVIMPILAAGSAASAANVYISDVSQGFVTGFPGPTFWAMLILGVGAVGSRLRRRAHATRVAPLLARLARDR